MGGLELAMDSVDKGRLGKGRGLGGAWHAPSSEELAVGIGEDLPSHTARSRIGCSHSPPRLDPFAAPHLEHGLLAETHGTEMNQIFVFEPGQQCGQHRAATVTQKGGREGGSLAVSSEYSE